MVITVRSSPQNVQILLLSASAKLELLLWNWRKKATVEHSEVSGETFIQAALLAQGIQRSKA